MMREGAEGPGSMGLDSARTMGGATIPTRGTEYSCIHVCVQVCALLQRCDKRSRQRGRSSCCGAPPRHPAGVAGGAPNRRGAHEVAVVRRAQQRHGVCGHWVGALQRRVPDAQQLALASCEAREDGHQRARRAALEEVKPGDRGTAHIPASGGKSAGSSCTCTPAHAMRRPPLAQMAGAPLSPLSSQSRAARGGPAGSSAIIGARKRTR